MDFKDYVEGTGDRDTERRTRRGFKVGQRVRLPEFEGAPEEVGTIYYVPEDEGKPGDEMLVVEVDPEYREPGDDGLCEVSDDQLEPI